MVQSSEVLKAEEDVRSSRGLRASCSVGAAQVLRSQCALSAECLSAASGILWEPGCCQVFRHVQTSQFRGFPQMALKRQGCQLVCDLARFLVELRFILLHVALLLK